MLLKTCPDSLIIILPMAQNNSTFTAASRPDNTIDKGLLWMALLSLLLYLFAGCSQEERELRPPEIFLNDTQVAMEIEVGDTVLIEPKITYDYDSRYEWRKNEEVLPNNELTLEVIGEDLGRIEYFFKVTTPAGSDSINIPIDVIVLVDFQEFELAENSAWTGAADINGFASQGLWFPNTPDNNNSWWGFGYSNIFSRSTSQPVERNGAYAEAVKNEVFALIRQSVGTNPPALKFSDEKNHTLKSLKIANTTLGHYLMKFGSDDFERMGGPSGTNPDWCRVTITGLDTQGAVSGEIVFYLADYRFDNNKRDYIVDRWETIDLTALGAVTEVQFNLTTSMINDEQIMLSPEMFCLDELKVLD